MNIEVIINTTLITQFSTFLTWSCCNPFLYADARVHMFMRPYGWGYVAASVAVLGF